MGIDYSGNMIVGCKVKYIDLDSVLPEGMDFSDWCEKTRHDQDGSLL
jgi:hypothetical protein